MLADDVRLDMVERNKTQGAAVGLYFGNYSMRPSKILRICVWHGVVTRHPELTLVKLADGAKDNWTYLHGIFPVGLDTATGCVTRR